MTCTQPCLLLPFLAFHFSASSSDLDGSLFLLESLLQQSKLELISRHGGLKDLGAPPDLPLPNVIFLAAHLFYGQKTLPFCLCPPRTSSSAGMISLLTNGTWCFLPYCVCTVVHYFQKLAYLKCLLKASFLLSPFTPNLLPALCSLQPKQKAAFSVGLSSSPGEVWLILSRRLFPQTLCSSCILATSSFKINYLKKERGGGADHCTPLSSCLWPVVSKAVLILPYLLLIEL